MPRKDPMTWQGQPYFRWCRMLKGERLYCSCSKHLILPPEQWTEAGSRQAMREWWDRLMASRTQPIERKEQELADLTETLAKVDIAIATQQAIERAQALVSPNNRHVVVDPLADLRNRVVQTINSPPTQKDRTFVHQLGRWQEEKRVDMKPSSFANLVIICKHWQSLKFIGTDTDVGTIDAEIVRSFKLWAKSLPKSGSQKSQHAMYFSAFVSWLWKMDLIPAPPRNLNELRFTVPSTEVAAIPVENVREVLMEAKPHNRLYALLVLNTGMNNCDIGLLEKSQLQGNILTRKRVKTEDGKNVPVVRYKLWEETLALLNQHKCDHPTLMLWSSEKTVLYQAWYDEDGKPKKKDLVGQQWRRAKLGMTLEAMRRVGAQLLDSHDSYSDLYDYYLGHAPFGVGRKFYAKESEERFFRALEWLHDQIFPAKKEQDNTK